MSNSNSILANPVMHKEYTNWGSNNLLISLFYSRGQKLICMQSIKLATEGCDVCLYIYVKKLISIVQYL